MKIAIIGSRGYPYVYSGYETFVKELGERLVREGVGVTVYCHKNLFQDYPVKLNGINLVYLPTIERKTLAQFCHSLQAILHACLKDYDVILVVNSANGPLGIFTSIFRKKTVINVDGLEWKRPKWKGLGAKYFYFAAKLATRFYDRVVVDSAAMQEVYKEEFDAAARLVAYGANIKYPQGQELIKKRGLEKEGYYLVVARLIPDNNTDALIKEFLSSSSRKRLVIVGDSLYNDEYSRRLKFIKDRRIMFTGYVRRENELSELYLNCFIYLHGHEFGGTNPVLLDALGCGCAVAALDTVFNREVLKGTEYGLFFNKEPGNLKSLIEKLEANPGILADYRSKARDRVKEDYTWEKITGQYLELFRELSDT